MTYVKERKKEIQRKNKYRQKEKKKACVINIDDKNMNKSLKIK